MKHIKPLLLVGIIISLCSCNGQNKVNQEDITYDEIGSLYLRPDNIVLPSKENSDVSYEYYDNGSIKMEKFIQNGRIAREITY